MPNACRVAAASRCSAVLDERVTLVEQAPTYRVYKFKAE